MRKLGRLWHGLFVLNKYSYGGFTGVRYRSETKIIYNASSRLGSLGVETLETRKSINFAEEDQTEGKEEKSKEVTGDKSSRVAQGRKRMGF
jgi:hypothetical protein